MSPTPGLQTSAGARLQVVGRELPAEEYPRLAGMPLGQALPHPDSSAVAVVEVDGRIVATWAAMTTIHLDGCYIEPEYRGHPAVTKALITALFTLLTSRGVPAALTITQSPEVDALIARLGATPIPGQLWLLPIGAP